jgi:inosine-uridine nucleoside N-ribohydrolase
MGISGKDVDDGLAILYLLGQKDVKLHGITTTFGNSSVEDVYQTTESLIQELHITNIPLLKGAGSVENRRSEASDFLMESVGNNPNRITILATGSLTNLYAAYEQDHLFFQKLDGIVLMGGITETLYVGGRKLDELNISSDPDAAYRIFNSGCKVTALSGNLCLQALLLRDEFSARASTGDSVVYRFLGKKIEYWFREVERQFGIPGFHVWDVVAAVYTTDPGLFRSGEWRVSSSTEELKRGFLRLEKPETGKTTVTLPSEIHDITRFWNVVFGGWENILVRI